MKVATDTLIDGRYRVVGTLGRGAMAVVYLVRHEQLGTSHAMKVLELPSSVVRRRLLTEGTIQASLRSPHVVAVTDVVEVEGCPALLMELVHGPPLERLLAEGPLPLDVVRSLGTGILLGVRAAHRLGTIHRDLKPANVLVDLVDGRLVARITDFGLARALHPEASGGGATRTGTTLGTPAYMAPEQIRDARSVDERADVFGLGAVLYELVCGRRAFPGDDLLEIYDAIRVGRTAPLTSLRPDATPAMLRTVEAALQVDLGTRARDVDTLLALWSEGVEDPLACDVPPALLATVERLGPAAASASSASSGTGSSGATFDLRGEAEALPSAVVELIDDPASPAAPARRWWPWIAVTVGLVVAVGLACGLSGTVAGVGTMGAMRHFRRSPSEVPDPVAPRGLARAPGTEALLAADPARAVAEARAAVEAAEGPPCAEPDACLALAVGLLELDDPEGYVWLDRAATEGRDEELGPLVGALREVARSGLAGARDLGQLGRGTRRGALTALLVTSMEGLPPPLRVEAAGGAMDSGAEAPLRLTRARLLLAEGRAAEAGADLDAVPEPARGGWYRTSRAEWWLLTGDAAAARQAGPPGTGPRDRWVAAGSARLADGAAEGAALVEAAAEPSARAVTALGVGEVALGRGAWSEARDRLGESLAAVAAADLPTRWFVARRIVQPAFLLDDRGTTASAALLLRSVAGELVGAESEAARLRSAADALEHGSGPALVAEAGRCVGPLVVARARAGRRIEDGALGQLVGSGSDCLAEGGHRFARGEAEARLAMDALAAGDRAAAGSHLAAYDAALPEADLELPFYAGIEKVREELAAPL